MRTLNEKWVRFRLTPFLAILVIIMFGVTVVLSFILLTNDNLNCQRQEYIVYQKIVSTTIKPFPRSNHRLAVLVPFRDRFDEMLVFAPHVHDFLNHQEINHDIFLLHQVDKFRFNRASLINVGYIFTKAAYDYIAMHDIDLLPLNKNLSYSYPKDQPFHVAAPNLHPKYHYPKFVGGILLVNREQFNLVNGMSNNYWGWGLEDDEFFVRLRDANLNVSRPINISTGMNDTFKHNHDKNHRKRDTVKCYNQKEVTRKRDRKTGLHNVNFVIESVNNITIDGAPVTIVNIQLICDRKTTPWCDCTDIKQN